MNKAENVKEQYKDDKNLVTRIKLHVEYSTNKQGFFPWLFEKYEFLYGYRILELGCGNGEQWNNRIQQLPEDCLLVLSDISDGLVKNVWERYSKYNNFLAQKVDISNIQFPDNSFDVVIANHMLYHVPDIPKAISEVKRVLKNDGKFYTSTNGKGGLREYLHNAFRAVNPSSTAFTQNYSFNLQNGAEILREHFKDVKRFDYEDSLRITDTNDLIEWLKSTISIATYCEKDIEGLYDYFEEIRLKEGAINIPKEAGLFICTSI